MQRPFAWLLVTTVTAVATHQGLSRVVPKPSFDKFAEVPSESAPTPESSAPDEVPEPDPVPLRTLDWADPAPGSEIDPVTGLPRVVVDKQHGFRLILVNTGTFERGLRSSELSSANAKELRIDQGYARAELPAHEVTLTQAFYLGECEVTQGQWAAVMGNRPAHHDAGDDYPIERVKRKQVMEFLALTGYRLPTESEWEYAARADSVPLVFSSGALAKDLPKVAWYKDNSGLQSWKVATRQQNAWGFYDMLGNVSEFCSDIHDKGLYLEAMELGAVDPQGSEHGNSWVVRGSNFKSSARDCRPTLRFSTSGGAAGHIGFRLARTP